VIGWWCRGLLVCSGCVGVRACVERERGSPGPHARLAVARSPGKMTPRRPPASPPRCDRSWGEEEEAASSPIAGQLLMRLPAADSVQNQAGLWRERERGGRKRGRRVEPRTDHADLTRCPTTASTQRYCPSCNARVHCKAHAVIRCRSWRQRANDRTMRELESPEKHLRRQAAYAMTIIGV